MAHTFNCKCEERAKPIADRAWRVTDYKTHHSAFSGYKATSSDWSTVCCDSCGAIGRTKARYVDTLVAHGKS